MPEATRIVLDGSSSPVEDELRLPRPPGVIRRFWARHPRLLDGILVALALLFSVPAIVFSAVDPFGDAALSGAWLPIAALLVAVTAVALLWRRRHPIPVFAVAFSPFVVLDPMLSSTFVGPAPIIALYSIAVYRSSRAAMWALAAGIIAAAGTALAWALLAGRPFAEGIEFVSTTMFLLVIGALVGVNVGGRKRYVEALIERSRQLLVERDQQAQLAAAAERTRIAREMHDIVSHSLAVVVALAEGANATDDVERSREASRAIASTAREALAEMRVMLGVLRNGHEEDSELPLGPLLELSVQDVVATARAAGVPVTLTVTGAPAGSAAQRLAVLRIVQEGLTNAMRYARDARRVEVVTDYTGGRIRVQLDNDGVGETAPSAGAGVGLRGLQERVTALGGNFSAGRWGPAGWRVVAEIPLESARD